MRFAVLLGALLPGLSIAFLCEGAQPPEYVGSKICAACHPSIYDSFVKTHMGHSISSPENDPGLKLLTQTVTVYDRAIDRYFEVGRKGNAFYQAEYQLDQQHHEAFRAEFPLYFAVGSGINGVSYLVRRDQYLFEAPLSWYSRLNKWDLSPSYDVGDRGFSRLIESGCISCHSGRSTASATRPGLFGKPEFREMSIGCENCHGPGGQHARLRGSGKAVRLPDASILNPARLSHAVADEICMNCHQRADARVLQPGKQESEFHPGMNSDTVYLLFNHLAEPGQAPASEVLEYNFDMRMSKCFRASSSGTKNVLSCTTCHDPHREPSGVAAQVWFKSKCLACHTEKSCTAAPTIRAATAPPDNCVSCHMIQHLEPQLSHAMLTNHRIVRDAAEPFPDEAYRPNAPGMNGVYWVNRPSSDEVRIQPDTAIEVYALFADRFPQLEALGLDRLLALEGNTHQPLSAPLLEFSAREDARKESPEGDRSAIRFMQRAIDVRVGDPLPYLEMALWMKREHDAEGAVRILQRAAIEFPYDRGVSRALIDAYGVAGRTEERVSAIQRHLHTFPEDTDRFKAETAPFRVDAHPSTVWTTGNWATPASKFQR